MPKFEVKAALRMPTRANLTLGGNIFDGTISVGDKAVFCYGAEDVQLEIIGLLNTRCTQKGQTTAYP